MDSTKPSLLDRLKADLTSILEKVKTDPWSLLMFQTLLWSFRRWAIHYLMTPDMTDTIREYVWDTYIDLVREFAPDGLKDFGVIWLNPTNVGERTDILEELNVFFMTVVDAIEAAIEKEDTDAENDLAIFLDDQLTEIIDVWLAENSQYRIYPRPEEDQDGFSAERVFDIMQLILIKEIRPAAAALAEAPAAATEPAATPAQPAAVVVPRSQPQPTIESAIRRRKTLRAHRKHIGKYTRKVTPPK